MKRDLDEEDVRILMSLYEDIEDPSAGCAAMGAQGSTGAVVALFGSTDLRLTAPGLPGDPRHRLLSNRVPCAPCFLRECPIDFRCLTGISPSTALQAVLEVLEHRLSGGK